MEGQAVMMEGETKRVAGFKNSEIVRGKVARFNALYPQYKFAATFHGERLQATITVLPLMIPDRQAVMEVDLASLSARVYVADLTHHMIFAHDLSGGQTITTAVRWIERELEVSATEEG